MAVPGRWALIVVAGPVEDLVGPRPGARWCPDRRRYGSVRHCLSMRGRAGCGRAGPGWRSGRSRSRRRPRRTARPRGRRPGRERTGAWGWWLEPSRTSVTLRRGSALRRSPGRAVVEGTEHDDRRGGIGREAQREASVDAVGPRWRSGERRSVPGRRRRSAGGSQTGCGCSGTRRRRLATARPATASRPTA